MSLLLCLLLSVSARDWSSAAVRVEGNRRCKRTANANPVGQTQTDETENWPVGLFGPIDFLMQPLWLP